MASENCENLFSPEPDTKTRLPDDCESERLRERLRNVCVNVSVNVCVTVYLNVCVNVYVDVCVKI